MKKSMRGVARVIVDDLAERPAKEAAKAMTEIVGYLASRNLLSRWRDLEREIGNVWKEKFGVSKVTIVSAHALQKKSYDLIEQFAPGAEIVERTDERLMGGAVLRIDDRRIDGSVIGALLRLKNKLLE